MKTILFVCTGNTCRSPMAEAILGDLLGKNPALANKYTAASAGISAYDGAPMTALAKKAVEALGIKTNVHFARRFDRSHAEEAALILTMEGGHLYHILERYPEAAQKASTLKGFARGLHALSGADLEIDDPIGGGADVYTACAKEIYDALSVVLSILAQ